MKGRYIIVALLLLAVGFYAYSQSAGDGSDDLSMDDDMSDDGVGDDSSGGTDVATKNDLVTEWAALIQKFEGYFPGSRSYRNNNPGNLVEQGDAGTDADGYAVFSSYEAGLAALESDLAAKLRKYPSQTIQWIMNRYAPPPDGSKLNAGNDPTTYAQNIAAGLSNFFGSSITSGTTLSQLLGFTQG